MKRLALIAVTCIAGCSQTNPVDYIEPSPVYVIPQCPMLIQGVKYIPEAGAYIDWSEDFYSWHYHGREREATPQEIALFELDEQSSVVRNEEYKVQLVKAREALLSEYAPILEKLAQDDAERYENRLNAMVGFKSQEHPDLAGK